ncbi:hypothetical protein Angca_002417, partial [Angiostrongylus cantonensis]
FPVHLCKTPEASAQWETLVERCFGDHPTSFVSMDEPFLPPLTPLDQYMETEGKLAASIRWLILRVYGQEKDIPDKLRLSGFRDERGHLQLDIAILTGLTNGSLYCQAAAKIFKEPHLVTQSHGAVIAALTDYGVDVVQCSNGKSANVTEDELFTADSFQMAAHLAMMDALMLAHLRNVITVDRVIDAVSRHTTVDESERPMDSVDALLFWINKVCLLVRDDVERSQIQLKEGGMIPEMEDLYDEISDGQCLCALVAWYRPREMDIEEVCYNDQMSTADCHYNLFLLQRFCHNNLPWNPFHFEIEDILYLRDSLQMNINAFLADLFDIFEPAPTVVVQPEPMTSPRRFVPIQPIPDLRAGKSVARTPQSRSVRNPLNTVLVTCSEGGSATLPSRSTSMMSQDSLMTNRLFHRRFVFSELRRLLLRAKDSHLTTSQRQASEHTSASVSPYARSDSLPIASIRLALEEKRRDHEKRKALINTMTESERAEKGKAAFFALMSNFLENAAKSDSPDSKLIRELDRKLTDLMQRVALMSNSDEQRIIRAISQPSVYQGTTSARAEYGTLPHNVGSNAMPNYAQPFSQQQKQEFYGYAQPHQVIRNIFTLFICTFHLRSSLSNGVLNYLPGQAPPYGEYPTGLVQPQQMQTQPMYSPDMYSSPLSGAYSQQSRQPAYAMSSMMAPSASSYSSPQSYAQTPVDTHIPCSFAAQPQTPMLPAVIPQQHGQSYSSYQTSSRVDPPLEINRNLTNWGMTYQQGHTARLQRRTWENQTFIKSQQDLVNQPDLVPTVPSDDVHFIKLFVSNLDHVAVPSQPSPPRDPSNNMNGVALDSTRNVSSTGPAFVVSDDQVAEDFDKIAEQRRQAKRAALLAKTMKRKEEIENKVDQIEQRNAEKRMAEIAKREMAEQRKLEKELQRQKILDDYKRRKMEKDLGIESGSTSSRGSSGRGHSQPPFIRAKSQMSESIISPGSSDKARLHRMRGQSTVEQRIPVQSLQEPTHKLFAKAVPKSNRGLVINALQYSVFPGAVNDATRVKTMNDLSASDAKHFLVLFRDNKCQYRGLYSWDQVSDTAIKISGQGPSKCSEGIMKLMFKYDSGAKNFMQIPTRHLSATIDGFTIQDQFWQKPKVANSCAVSHRNN